MDRQKKRKAPDTPTIATGIDDDAELEAKATKEEVARGDYTRVTRLVWDGPRDADQPAP